ncbi:MAG: elongation factor G [Spirochaetales bacterium]|nr:elongation factor G [Spirochaetales bacterium]
MNIRNMRNIGISAHIDSGKTTLTERILFYCKKIHRMGEVRGKTGKGATMDSMELEQERGITIASAATNVEWKDHSINIIDTPGHVDFTIEVERALRVLDGAILVLCAVGGVQSQSITVDRQLRRYSVPHIAFINKCDRVGANPFKVKDQLCEKLRHNAVLMQIPMGIENNFQGVVDLVLQKALYFDGPYGETVRVEEIPGELKEKAAGLREEIIDKASMFSDELAESYLEGKETVEQIMHAVRTGAISQKLIPVFMGSAYKNKGIQPLIDAIVSYLPSPGDVKHKAFDTENDEKEIVLKPDPALPALALAFKLEDGKYGQLTYIRLYQGRIAKGSELYNVRSRKKIRIGRLVKMHADTMEDITQADGGDIVALFGIDCTSGDTFTQGDMNLSMSSMYVPEPVISLAIKALDRKSEENIAKALGRFTKEDPTFQTYVDEESKETIIRGMGELHLDIYIQRMKREYGIQLETGAPQVAYRETITQRVPFDYTHKKQSGGAGQYGRVAGVLEPLAEGNYEFADEVKGGVIPKEYVASCNKGFMECLKRGNLIGFPVTGVKVTVNDGNTHPVDSSDIAFQAAAIGAFRQAYMKAGAVILEPVMKVEVETPSEYQGNVFASINQRRGIVISTTEDVYFSRIEAEVPLSEMFGYSTVLRSISQGKAEFTMEFVRYGRVPQSLADELIIKSKSKNKKE